MITDYANRMHESVTVRILRAWRPGLRNGDIVTMPEPEVAKAIRIGFAEVVDEQESKPKKRGRPRKVTDDNEPV
jgi:hypothetical protein